MHLHGCHALARLPCTCTVAMHLHGCHALARLPCTCTVAMHLHGCHALARLPCSCTVAMNLHGCHVLARSGLSGVGLAVSGGPREGAATTRQAVLGGKPCEGGTSKTSAALAAEGSASRWSIQEASRRGIQEASRRGITEEKEGYWRVGLRQRRLPPLAQKNHARGKNSQSTCPLVAAKTANAMASHITKKAPTGQSLAGPCCPGAEKGPGIGPL